MPNGTPKNFSCNKEQNNDYVKGAEYRMEYKKKRIEKRNRSNIRR